ncbi:hypothetical protein MY4824_002283 [Beauveria thailandica]
MERFDQGLARDVAKGSFPAFRLPRAAHSCPQNMTRPPDAGQREWEASETHMGTQLQQAHAPKKKIKIKKKKKKKKKRTGSHFGRDSWQQRAAPIGQYAHKGKGGEGVIIINKTYVPRAPACPPSMTRSSSHGERAADGNKCRDTECGYRVQIMEYG